MIAPTSWLTNRQEPIHQFMVDITMNSYFKFLVKRPTRNTIFNNKIDYIYNHIWSVQLISIYTDSLTRTRCVASISKSLIVHIKISSTECRLILMLAQQVVSSRTTGATFPWSNGTTFVVGPVCSSMTCYLRLQTSVEQNVFVLGVGNLMAALQPPHRLPHVFGLKRWCVSPLFTNIQRCENPNYLLWVIFLFTGNSSLPECVIFLPSSTISPAKTLEIPDMAITTFWETEDPVIDWIS